jgi:hypothetical protein
MCAKVFVPEVEQLNEVVASARGTIVPLMPKDNKMGLEPDRIRFLMEKPLGTFQCGDYLLLDGRNVHCAVAASILASQRNSIDMLLWDRAAADYTTRTISLIDIPKSQPIVSNIRVFLINDMHSESQGIIPHPCVALTQGSDPNVMEPENIKTNMIQILKNSSDQDFILSSGSKTHNVVAACVMCRMHKRVNFMIWNAKAKRYEKRTVIFGGSYA